MRITQQERIYSYLKEGNSLTSRQAYDLFGCTRLAAQVFELRKKGIPIQSKQIDVKNRYGEPCHVSQYWIDPVQP